MEKTEEKVETKQEVQEEQKKNTLKDYFLLGDVARYFFRKKDPERPVNFNIKVMHGINRLSIVIFLLAIIFLILKRII